MLKSLAAAALLGATTATALLTSVPAIAQQSTGERILKGVLDALNPQQPKQETQQQQEQQPTVAPLTLADVLADPRRDADRARDRYRNPAEALAFFQVEPGMTVVDYMPNGWWYTRILVPWLGANGRYIAMNPDVKGMTGYWENTYDNVAPAVAAEHAKWASPSDAEVSGFNTQDYPAALDGTVDRVLIFREMHNQFRFGWLHADLLAVRKMLKPGGLVGIVDHRANENAPFSMTDGNKGYLRQSDVINLMDAYGFDLVASSEMNANSRDTKDYAQGVWALPPTLMGATSRTRAKMLAIGESDRMTLLFRMRP